MRWALLLAACGGGAGAPDAGPTDGWQSVYDEQAPFPLLGSECTPQVPLHDYDSTCEANVCALDATCCSEMWSVRCTRLAARFCPGLTCSEVLTFAGDLGVGFVRDDGAAPIGSGLDTGDLSVISSAWADHDGDWLAELATQSDCTTRVFLFGVEMFRHAADDCTTFHGQRVRWADIDGDRMLDVVAIGQGGAYWIRAMSGGAYVYGGEIVPAGDGALADLVLTDLDHDGAIDAIAAFSDGPARVYHHGPNQTFTPTTWTSTTTGATRLALCDSGVVLAGPNGVEDAARHAGGLAAGVVRLADAATDLACGTLDPDTSSDSIVTVTPAGALDILGPSGTVWRSDTDLAPPLTIQGAHVTTGATTINQFADDVIVAPPGGSGEIPYLTLTRDDTGGWMVTGGIDPRPDHAAGEIEAADVRTSLP